MTYCVAINVEDGLVLMSDTRTNAGMDNVSRFRKMFTWTVPGERALCLMSSGNLSITQGIITHLCDAIRRQRGGEEGVETILTAPTMYRVAELVGAEMARLQEQHGEMIERSGAKSGASMLVAGQRKGGLPRLFLVYSAGNFIEATHDTPFFQIGDHKYGKPILDRVITPATSLSDAVKAAMVSMDSTIRSNLSVGMPLDFAVIRRDTLAFAEQRRINIGDPAFLALSRDWSEALLRGFDSLPPPTLGDEPRAASAATGWGGASA